MNRKKDLLILVECAVMVALATVLSYIKVYEFPFGGSITLLSMLPILLVSFRRGVKVGLGTAFVYSVIQLIQGFSYLSYAPTAFGVVGLIFLDYILPFTILGLAGIFYKEEYKSKKAMLSIVSGTSLVLLVRYACHVLSGVIIWYAVTKAEAKEGDWILTVGSWVYSIGYNAAYMGPEIAITLLASPVIIKLKDFIKE
ncbi:MAG: energy-coupled thiamine transporter ThiT [Eubacteriales bacterium]|nr:energy-coupled thiamine transporter ThiT [Eubacteriales bacterium]MDD4422842.1 energy-coupled thiamine transporter ThiT [Eubacteriales bacterium]